MNRLSDLKPEVLSLVEKVAEIYIKHTDPWFIGLVIHGSAVKGGFIQGSSDIDFVLYVEDSALDHLFQLPLSLTMAIQRDLARLDIHPFRYIQFRVATPTHHQFGNVIPGAYRLVAGRLLYSELSNKELIGLCQKGLTELDPERILSSHRLLDHGEGRLQRIVRGMCTEVYPVLFQVLTIKQDEGYRIWNLNKFDAIECLPEDSELGHKIRQFYVAVTRYYPDETNVDDALSIIEYGMEFLHLARQWWEKQIDQ